MTTPKADSASDYVLDPGSEVGGRTIAEWTEEFWIWAIGAPSSGNPFFDETGQFANQRNDGDVFFLAGTISNIDPADPDPTPGFAERDITVCAGVPLLVPMINVVLSEPETPAADQAGTLDELLSPINALFLSIDGEPVPDLFSHYEQTEPFSLGELQDNTLGEELPFFRDPRGPVDPETGLPPPVAPGTRLEPAMGAGWYVMIDGLPPGEHTLEYGGGIDGNGDGDLEDTADTPIVEIHVNLQVVGHDPHARAADYAF
jgi:hypothetical protein